MQIKKALVISALSFNFPINSSAEDFKGNQLYSDQKILLRAKTDKLPKQLVELIAQSSGGESVSLKDNISAKNMTVKDVIIGKCGSIQEGYLNALNDANKGKNITIGADTKINEIGDQLTLPNCLYINDYAGQEAPAYSIKYADSLSTVYDAFSGGGYNEAAIGKSFPQYSKNLNAIKVGESVKLPFLSAPSAILMGADKTEELKRFKDIVAVVDADYKSQYGKINMPVDAHVIGRISKTNKDCSYGKSDYPFVPDEVYAVYEFLSKIPSISAQFSKVAIIDNGFLGVIVDQYGTLIETDGMLTFQSPFFAKLFLLDAYRDELGPSVADTPSISAINYKNVSNLHANSISGHGTHVAGIVIGGKIYQKYVERIFSNNLPFIKLIPINVNRGSEYLSPNSDARINQTLTLIEKNNIPDVVNFSIAYEAGDSYETPSPIKANLNLIIGLEKYNNTLFVASAGNEGIDLSSPQYQLYPAKFGGIINKNVITIGSYDDDGNISKFSNYGKKHVDIVAPGCHIESWIDSKNSEYLSGTSQAAPAVTFVSAQLKAMWRMGNPITIKNRIFYSGDLLPRIEDREKVRSKSKLNIVKTLLFTHDYITVLEDSVVKTYLGTVMPISQLSCNENEMKDARYWKDIQSVKRDSNKSVYIFSGDKFSDNAEVCKGELNELSGLNPNTITFRPEFEIIKSELKSFEIRKLDAGEIITRTLPVSSLIEVIKKF